MTTVPRSAILVIALLAATAPTAMGAGPIELVECDDSGITLRYDVPEARIEHGSGTAVGYSDVKVPGTSLTGVEGAPALPFVSVRVAVPDCERIEVSVLATGSRTERGVRVTPSPTAIRVGDGELSNYGYEEGPDYESPGLWPSEPVALFGPSWIGTQRVATIEFYPCQAAPAEETLVLHEALEVRLSFIGLRRGMQVRSDRQRRETMLRSTLLNYEEGRAWRVRPSTAPARPSGDYFTTSANWVKLVVRERGMHRVSPQDLEDLGVDPGAIDPSTIRVLSGGGLPVPWDVTEDRADWMDECTILVEGEGDGTLDPGDGIVFYGLPVDGWADELGADDSLELYHENPFANDNVYWLTWEAPGTPSGFAGEPLRMEDYAPSVTSPSTFGDYRARAHFERSVKEIQGRGDGWFWYEMKLARPEEWYQHVELDHVVTDSTGLLRVQARGNSDRADLLDHHAIFSLNGDEAIEGEWSAYTQFRGEAGGLAINDGANTFAAFVPREGLGSDEPDYVLIDWFDIEYWRELRADADQLLFGNSGRTGAVEFSVEGFTNDDLTVFRIRDRNVVDVVQGAEVSGGSVVFSDNVVDTATYAAVAAGGYLSPASVESDDFGDLRSTSGADYIMIVHDDFYDEAARLRSHRESEVGGSFDVRLVRVSDVYDEFSWGLVDPAAIRDYLKYAHDSEPLPPTHALLIGDASSDYRHYLPSSVPSFIPAAYSTSILHWPQESWYVAFTSTSFYDMALALGRLSARSSSELGGMIDKIERYEAQPVPGLWKNTAMIIADDEYKADSPDPSAWDCCEYFHTRDADSLSRLILPKPIDRLKIYLMEYDHDSAGQKPEARDDILEAWNEGVLLVNYVGHGSEILMAHEYVFLYDDIARLSNIDALPLYFASSCRLNKFDRRDSDSLGELLVKSRAGGAIGSIGSTRDSGATANTRLNGWFYHHMFGGQTENTRAVMDIGTAFQCAFSSGYDWNNNTKFCLIGDPAVTLAAPRGGGLVSTAELEPMKRRDTVTLEARNQGVTEGRSGVAVLRVSESADTSGYLHDDPLNPPQKLVRYALPGRRIFDGPVSVAGGEFSASFVVSALATEGGHGRVRAYYYDEDEDGAFSLEDVAIRDSVDVADAVVPEISLEFEGGATSVLPGAKLAVSVSDDNGVNLVDGGGDEGITLHFNSGQGAMSLTDEFLYDLDSSEGGTIELELPSLDYGGNSVSVSASDNMRNRATRELAFEIVSATDFKIRDVASHPNPFPDGDATGTHILFQLPASADVTIEFFTVGGRLIRVIEDIAGVPGANQVYWDGRDQDGDDLANGVYLYRVSAVSDAYRGDRADAVGRAVVMR